MPVRLEEADRRRERELCLNRAGMWPRQKTRDLQLRYLCEKRRVLATGLLIGLGVTPAIFLLPHYSRQFIAGAWLAAVIAYAVASVFVGSGTAYQSYGADAERWTAQELWKCRSGGWRTVSHVERDGWDMDHVSIGPGGTLVIQTKWTSDEGEIGPNLWSFDKAVKYLRDDARTMGLLLHGKGWESSVHPVIVYWGPWLSPDSADATQELQGVTALKGNRLRDWIQGMEPDPKFAQKDRDAMWKKLTLYVERKDRTSDKITAKPFVDNLTAFIWTVVTAMVSLVLIFLISSQLPIWAGVGLSLGSFAALTGLKLFSRTSGWWLIGGIAGSLVSGVVLGAAAIWGGF
jgi:hypothetical protein